MAFLKIINHLVAYPLILIILLYQKTLSPDHGLVSRFYPFGFCRFYPSCSTYALTVLKQEGIRGLFKITKRLASCNPKSLGGIDLPYPNL